MNLSLRGTAESIELNDFVFGSEFREALVHQVLAIFQQRGHTGTKKQKNRSEVRGSGAKPWRQKGTGRARAGTRQSPIWTGGGVTFAARPVKRKVKMNRKMYRGAMRSILSELVRQERLLAISSLPSPESKTRKLLTKLDELDLSSVLLVDAEVDESLERAARNLYDVDVVNVSQLNPVSLLKYDHVLFSVDGLRRCEEAFA